MKDDQNDDILLKKPKYQKYGPLSMGRSAPPFVKAEKEPPIYMNHSLF